MALTMDEFLAELETRASRLTAEAEALKSLCASEPAQRIGRVVAVNAQAGEIARAASILTSAIETVRSLRQE